MNNERNLFTGAIPGNYDQYLGPLLFEPNAVELVKRINVFAVKDALETACGTGRVTKHLTKIFAGKVNLIATDYSEEMIQIAKATLSDSHIKFMQADMQSPPFSDNSFDLVICQFGVMFLPEKPKAFKEVFRVLKNGGMFLFNTWDSLENNEATAIVNEAVAAYFNNTAPSFFHLPHSMYDVEELQSLMKDAGFKNISVERILIDSTSPSAEHVAKGFVFGTPMYGELVKLDPASPEIIANNATKMLIEKYGNGIIKTRISAFICKCNK